MAVMLTASEANRNDLAKEYLDEAIGYFNAKQYTEVLRVVNAAGRLTMGISKPLAVRDQLHDLKTKTVAILKEALGV